MYLFLSDLHLGNGFGYDIHAGGPALAALLSELEPLTTALTTSAAALRSDLRGATWLVEAFVANPQLTGKVSFATKNGLMSHGLHVSDRTPTLGPADLDVLMRLPPEQAYPAACTRYAATGSVGPGDVLLSVITLDPRETILHAGLCEAGQWTWLP